MSQKPIKILLLAPTTVVGGITTWVKTVLKYYDPHAIELNIIDTSKLYDPYGKKLNLRGAILGIKDAIYRFIVLVRTIKNFSPDLVYFTCAPSIGFIVRDCVYMLILQKIKIPVIAHLHGGNIKGFWSGNSLVRLIAINALKTCCAIIVITREIEIEGKKIFGNRVIYFPNMFDDELFYQIQDFKRNFPDARPAQLLHIGWQSPEKGSFDLVEAISVVSHKVKCNMVGIIAPANKAKLERRISALKLNEKVFLTGQKIGEKLRNEFLAGDIFVFPTHNEGFPMVVLEAMSFSMPVVASDVGNIREILGIDSDKPAGIILQNIAPINTKELAGHIDDLLSNKKLYMELASNGRLRIKEKYLASKVVNDLMEFITAQIPFPSSDQMDN